MTQVSVKWIGHAARVSTLALAVLALTACSEALTTNPDLAELANIRDSRAIPNSSPAQLVQTFQQVCVDAPGSYDAKEALLRDLSYVPVRAQGVGGSQLFVVDDRRPAFVLTERMCTAVAEARTGQSERFEDYVVATFPAARPLDPASFDRNIEKAWQVSTPAPGIVASQREPYQAITRYSLIYFRAGAA
ncbi:MAG: hypothetical protein AAGA15_15115 [Pseudomonadota bacterium]